MKSNDVLEHLRIFAISFVFDFCVFIAVLAISFCVPENFDERALPLRAYRKVMRFRLLFRSIRDPKDLRKPLQPDKEIQPESPLRLEILHFKGELSGTYRSGGRYGPLERIVKAGSLPEILFPIQTTHHPDRIRAALKTGCPFLSLPFTPSSISSTSLSPH